MNLMKEKMIAEIVKEKRKALGYTQQEVSDISNVSLRSIQRIEKGEVMPRMYTLKALSECLGFSLNFLNPKEAKSYPSKKMSLARKVIYSIGFVLIIILLASAFIAQSSSFPETHFEFLMYCALMVGIITIGLLRLWNPVKHINSKFTSNNK